MDVGVIALTIVFVVAVAWAFRTAARREASGSTTPASVGFGGADAAVGGSGGCGDGGGC